MAIKIIEESDLANGLVDSYKQKPPVQVPVSESTLDLVKYKSNYASDYFKYDTSCLNDIGEMYGHRPGFTFVLVSEFVYSYCPEKPYWKVAKARHTYYTTKGHQMCAQDSGNLFSVHRDNGKTSTNTKGC